jgi:uncharacterized protein
VFRPERRRFLGRTAGALIGLGSLGILSAHRIYTMSSSRRESGDIDHDLLSRNAGYGSLHSTADQNGDAILALPRRFRYVTFSPIGSPMTDGNLTPQNLDGMCAFAGPANGVRLIRNHEVRLKANDPRVLAVEGFIDTRYDRKGVGGCVTVDFEPKSLMDPVGTPPVKRDFISLNGTIVNCAGGYAYRDAGWITCEETVEGPGQGWSQKHGYAFLVPRAANDTFPAMPLVGLGRFAHEAAVADPATGIVYQTEDAGSGRGSGFYRFVPEDPNDLLEGGTLQILGIDGMPAADMRQGQIAGLQLKARWFTIKAPDPDLENGAQSVFAQGRALGGALFNRLEGIFRGEHGAVYFVSTSGGNAKSGDINSDGFAEGYGQLWEYMPRTNDDELKLVYESAGRDALDSPDNLCVTPRGSFIFCEDDTGYADTLKDTHPNAAGITNINRVIGLGRDGVPFTFAVNLLNDTEFAGACFSPDGNILFVNIYGDGTANSGMTCAITGPWDDGPL